MVMWEKDWGETRHFNAENNTLSVITVDDIKYTFDIETGNIIDKKIFSENIRLFIILISGITACVLIVIFLVAKKLKYKILKN